MPRHDMGNPAIPHVPHEHQVQKFTDSRAAKSLVEANDAAAGGRLLRWRLALTEFEFEVLHRKGEKNGNADGLSRLPIKSTTPYDEDPTSIDPYPSLNVMWQESKNEFLNANSVQMEAEQEELQSHHTSKKRTKKHGQWMIGKSYKTKIVYVSTSRHNSWQRKK
jgi:hypothetical protein